VSTGLLMGRKKGEADPAPEGEAAEPLFSIKGRRSWLEWVDRLQKFDRQPSRSALVDRALMYYARHIEFKEDPPER
jgi:hypothetical protein